MDYQRCIKFWDQVFSQESNAMPNGSTTGNEALDRALQPVKEPRSIKPEWDSLYRFVRKTSEKRDMVRKDAHPSTCELPVF